MTKLFSPSIELYMQLSSRKFYLGFSNVVVSPLLVFQHCAIAIPVEPFEAMLALQGANNLKGNRARLKSSSIIYTESCIQSLNLRQAKHVPENQPLSYNTKIQLWVISYSSFSKAMALELNCKALYKCDGDCFHSNSFPNYEFVTIGRQWPSG